MLLPGLVPDIPAYSVKVNAKFPRARPALRGLVGLHDTGTGELLAVLDSATVTAWRTGLAAAWPPTNWPVPRRARWRSSARGPRRNWCCGDGPHCGSWQHLTVYDLEPGIGADQLARRYGASTVARGRQRAGGGRAGLVIVATWSRAAAAGRGPTCHPGSHVTSLGADEPGKAELSPGLLAAAPGLRGRRSARAGPAARWVPPGSPAETAAGTLSEVLRGNGPRPPDRCRAHHLHAGRPARPGSGPGLGRLSAGPPGRPRPQYEFLA